MLECIQTTRRVVQTHTNLGIVLLLAPLTAVPEGEALQEGVARILSELDEEDAHLVYDAIRLIAELPGATADGRTHGFQGDATGAAFWCNILLKAASLEGPGRARCRFPPFCYTKGPPFQKGLHDDCPG